MLQSQFVPQFSEENLESLLGSISESLPSSMIIPWLQDDLVPFVSKVLPQGLVCTSYIVVLLPPGNLTV